MNEHNTDRHGSGYAIWIGPNANSKEYASLERCIERIAVTHNTPTFPPHLTLLSGIKFDEATVVEQVRLLAASLQPLTIELEEVDAGKTYFQALFVRAKQTSELMAANHLAQQHCHRHKPIFTPHASLAYGDLTPATAAHIKYVFAEQIAATRCTFTTHSLDLWNTRGPLETWHHIKRFPLTNTPENSP